MKSAPKTRGGFFSNLFRCRHKERESE